MPTHNPDNEPDDEYWNLYTHAHGAHGQVLAVLEEARQLTLTNNPNPNIAAWALTTLQRIATTFEFGTPEHATIHNIITNAINDGPAGTNGTPAAHTAHTIHGPDIDLTSRDE